MLDGHNSETERAHIKKSLFRSAILVTNIIYGANIAPSTSPSSKIGAGSIINSGTATSGSVVVTSGVLVADRGHSCRNYRPVSSDGSQKCSRVVCYQAKKVC